ncbi:Transcriptional regulation of mitochondrial recombination [Teratosphaeria destructans]|uniref:Large ribosomal subunit protein mL67 n=1 Tax=Teratosphaeria destructans TaxID=418781 RepID=A0A9W7SX17_9PEZI|nr:Transcriptional regulation of mitochondrial recombination [Teratosphaeria destructans]
MRRPGPRGLPQGIGRYIYAYCHVRSKQVVYSFTHIPNEYRALKQLPDLGANNKDAALRKDLWKPLYTLCLPEGPVGQAQGLAVFRKLREWRKLHELHWEMPESLKMPFTEEHIDEKFKKRLENRGGNKKEHPHDLAKRAKKRMRVRLIQDQKANSVADLAAVLLEQDDMGDQMAQWKVATRAKERAQEVEEMRRLAEQARQGGIEKVEAEIKELGKRLEKVLAGEEDVEGLNRTRLRREIQLLELKQVRMEFAFRAVTRAEREAQHVKFQASEQSAQVKVAREFAELAEIAPKSEVARYEAKLARESIGENEPTSADAEQSTEAQELAKFDHKARLHQIQLLERKRVTGHSMATGSLPFIDGIKTEAAQWRALRAKPDFVVESNNLYKGSKAARALELQYLAEVADRDALQHIRSRIRKCQKLLEKDAGPGIEATQAHLNMLRIMERYMQLAATAAAKDLSTDMMAEANAIRTSVLEFAVRRAEENILTAQRAKRSNDIPRLERELAEAQKVLQEVCDTDVATAERNAAERTHRLPDNVQAGAVPEKPLDGEELSPNSLEQSAGHEDPAATTIEVDWASRLPSFPKHITEPLRKGSTVEPRQKRLKAPVFSTEGVTVKWQNIFDAEFAESWPENVKHERMGRARSTEGRRSTQHSVSAPLPETAAADEELASQTEESNPYAEGEQAPETRAEHRSAIFRVAKSQILRKVRELAQKTVRHGGEKGRHQSNAAKADRLGREVKPMKESSAQLG